MPGLGRLVVPDARDRQHLMSAHLPAATAPLLPQAKRRWTPGPTLDQGETSECTAYAWTNFLACTPLKTPCPAGWPEALYRAEQQIDGMPLPHDGSTVRAGAKVLASEGHLTEYVWAESVEDVARWLLHRGPVVAGTNWYRAMFTPDQNDTLAIGGPVDGGHAYLLYAVDAPAEWLWIDNSWGRSWGRAGVARISFETFRRLLAEDGECCTAIEKRAPA